LFRAKLSPSSLSRTAVSRNLLYALGGTVLLLAAGAAYVWYAISDNNPQSLHPVNRTAPIPVAQVTPNIAVPQISTVVDATKDNPVLNEAVTANATGKTQKSLVKHTVKATQNNRVPNIASSATPAKTIHIQPQFTESLDPLLNRAYLAYRNGKLDEAHQLYLEMLRKDAQNSDALLGLAAIAQQRGDDSIATQYYLRVLNLDPRNAVANAGMSALSANENYESRLKTLLHEQSNSAALHFALGNLFAEQSRWGEAQQAYFNAYTLDTKNADLAFNLAVSLDHLGQGKLAAQHYQHALQLDPSGSANFDHAKIFQRIDDLLR
jgi:tetratricopeptide (TPR) repeat protein